MRHFRLAKPLKAVGAAAAVALVFALLATSPKPTSSATVTARRPKSDQNCTDHLKFIDRCSSMATYSFTIPTSQYPNNTAEMKVSCERIGEGLKCLKIYTKCLTSLARRSVVSYSSARSRHSKKLCANLNDPKTQEFIKVGPCIAASNKRALMISNERELISAIQSMAAENTTLSWDDRLHGACCAGANFKTKSLKDLEPQCAKFKDAQEDMLNSMIGELLDTACPEGNRLKEICTKVAKHKVPKDWQAVSLTSAALDLIVTLSDTQKNP